MRWEDEDRMVAEYVLPGSGTWHPVVRLGARVLRAPPVALPYAPEFEPGSAKEGAELLRAVAAVGGGMERLSMVGLFAAAPVSEGRVALAPFLVGLALALLLAEVVIRRFLSTPRVRARKVAPAAVLATPSGAVMTTSPGGMATPARASAPEAKPQAAQEPGAAPAGGTETPASGAQDGGVDSALEAARARARRRLDR
jgi:predicted lipid-binding transport protein (Tim44 family)